MAQYIIRLNLSGNIISRLSQVERTIDRINRKAMRMPRTFATGINRFPMAGAGIFVPKKAVISMPGSTMGGRYRGMPVVYPPAPIRNPLPQGFAFNLPQNKPKSETSTVRYPYIPRRELPKVQSLFQRTKRIGNHMSQREFFRTANTAFKSSQRFRDDFVRNIFTPAGWRRNMGNLFSAIFDTATLAVKSNPALMAGAMATGLGAFAYAVPKIVGGLAYGVLSKTLNSTSMSDAIANRMQLDMAKRGLGTEYAPAFQEATKMAAEYGYSRSGIMSTINTISGFEIDGQKIGTVIAADIARMIGKVSQVGGRPYEVVGVNMQQLLAATKPNLRDVRELIHAAPILSKYALQDMQNRGVKDTSPYNWLQDRGNMLRALYRLDSEIKAPEAASSRGRIALAKENFWMDLAGMNRLWEVVGDAGERMFSRLSAQIQVLFQKADMADLNYVFDEFIDGVVDAVKALGTLSSGIISFANYIDRLNPFSAPKNHVNDRLEVLVNQENNKARNEAAEKLTTIYGNQYVTEFLQEDKNRKAWGLDTGTEEQRARKEEDARAALLKNFASTFGREIKEGLQTQPAFFQAPMDRPSVQGTLATLEENPGAFDKTLKFFVGEQDARAREFIGVLSKSLGKPTDLKLTPQLSTFFSTFQPDKETVAEALKKMSSLLTGGSLGAGGTDTKEIEDLTKGSKSLHINFNAPIVEMPTTINNADNAQQVAREMQRNIEDTISRGLQIAFNNTTRML